MNPERLRHLIEEVAQAVENHIAEEGPYSPRLPAGHEGPAQTALRLAGQRLNHSLNVLLPPRGAGSALDCPHCGKPITVSLSR